MSLRFGFCANPGCKFISVEDLRTLTRSIGDMRAFSVGEDIVVEIGCKRGFMTGTRCCRAAVSLACGVEGYRHGSS